MDMTSAAEVAGAVDRCSEVFGSLDILVCNAAIFGAGKNFLDIEEAEWAKTIDVNVGGPFLCAQLAAKQMSTQDTGGSIVFISSVSGSSQTKISRTTTHPNMQSLA
ncbi:hypothetical protein CM1200mP19_1380 [bacterium]|nr:MAG: hypothetical protein CM1200mP19_1380 [bacterium]